MNKINNKNLIKYIYILEFETVNENVNTQILTSFEELIETITEKRKILENDQVYSTNLINFVNYIFKRCITYGIPKKLIIDFCQFSKNIILFIARRLKFKLNLKYCFHFFEEKQIIFNLRKINNEDRYFSFCNFILNFSNIRI